MNVSRILLLLLLGLLFLPADAAGSRPNVLFIAVDDLRPQLGCYGNKFMKSPNIDRLAASGIVFERSYCMVPTCGASRASLMTGTRPARNRFVNYMARADKDAPGVLTLNTHFKNNGYHTVSNGKIFHYPQDNEAGWSEKPWRVRGQTYMLAESLEIVTREAKKPGKKKRRGPAFESADVSDEAYRDGQLADRAIADLRRLATMDRPFFLAVGFFKPHLPFIAPKKYWDLYDPEKVRLPSNYHRPEDAPDIAIHNWGELRNYADVPARGPVSDAYARKLIHGYYACVSYTDALIGKVLDELDRLDLAKKTIVILWGDHGWNLGEHTLWCKHCNFETSMRAPIIMRAPGMTGGVKTRALVEFIDIYPTLCELADLSLPGHLQGKSMAPLLKNPNLEWKNVAIGRYRQGDTIRTDRYRYTEYTNNNGSFLARMLYDHRHDPDENINISEREESRKIIKKLARQLHEGMGRDRKR